MNIPGDIQNGIRNFLDDLTAVERTQVRLNVPLCSLTTLQIGGPAAIVCNLANPDHARRFHNLALKHKMDVFVLGGGSNVLGDDKGFPGVILHVATTEFQQDDTVITAGGGLEFDAVIRRSLDLQLTGLEFASGIPGTLGGAIVGNAGCYGHEIGEFLLDAQVLLPDGEIATIGPDDFGFRYRETDIRETGHILLSARLQLQRGDIAAAQASRTAKLDDRQRKHPTDLPCAGSWFRNLPAPAPGARRQAAGHFLEQVGAKEMSEGDALVFALHANMIVNSGQATSGDVLKLAARMHDAVLERFALELVPEVRHLVGVGRTAPTT